MSYSVGIDLGGTNIVAGVVDETGRLLAKSRRKTKTPRPAEEICDDMAGAVRDALREAGLSLEQAEWVGLGTPGIVDAGAGLVRFANNLGFLDTPVRAMLEERLGKTVYVENDANAAAYGELMAGAGKGVRNMIAVTLGTGVGGGVVIDGRIFSGFEGRGAELGHMGILRGGKGCTCGRQGCLEAYASATGLINLTKEAMEAHPESRLWELAPAVEQVNGRTAFEAMRAGDPAGEAVVRDYVEYLAYGLVNYIIIFAPELIVIGGGVSKEGEPFLERIRRAVRPQLYRGAMEPRIVCAQLGNDAGVIGAALLGRMRR